MYNLRNGLVTHNVLTVSNIRAMIVVLAAFQSASLPSMTVNIASDMHLNALRSLTQPCLTAYCI